MRQSETGRDNPFKFCQLNILIIKDIFGIVFAMMRSGGNIMKKLKNNTGTKILVVSLALIFAAGIAAPWLEANDVCKKAYDKCILDAAVAALFGGFLTFPPYVAFCSSGYVWCTKYYYG